MKLDWRKLPIGLTIVTALAMIILIGLGTWQLARLKWKSDLLRDMAVHESADPITVSDALALKDGAWRPVSMGPCEISDTDIIPMHSALEGTVGYRWLAGCTYQGQALLLDLGFSESADAHFGSIRAIIVGHLRPIEAKSTFAPINNLNTSDWYWREPALLRQALKIDIRDDYFVVVDLKASNLSIDGLQQVPMTASLSNRHLEYALTWYGLALSLLGVYIAMAIKAMKAKPENA